MILLGTYTNSRAGVASALETCTFATLPTGFGREVRPVAGSHGWMPITDVRVFGADSAFDAFTQRFSTIPADLTFGRKYGKTQLGSRAHSPG